MNSYEQMREALELMVKAETDGTMERDALCGRCLDRFDCKHDGSCWVDKVMSALALPRRNCDVGTPEEQSVRMSEFCREQYKKTDGIILCSGCPTRKKVKNEHKRNT